MQWKTIDSAPKIDPNGDNRFNGPWILGVDSSGEKRVIRWTVEYPCTEGVWMFAYAPTDYIDNIQTFHPTHWMELPVFVKEDK